MSEATLGWLAADYHLPATYSCRPPLSSANSALILEVYVWPLQVAMRAGRSTLLVRSSFA